VERVAYLIEIPSLHSCRLTMRVLCQELKGGQRSRSHQTARFHACQSSVRERRRIVGAYPEPKPMTEAQTGATMTCEGTFRYIRFGLVSLIDVADQRRVGGGL